MVTTKNDVVIRTECAGIECLVTETPELTALCKSLRGTVSGVYDKAVVLSFPTPQAAATFARAAKDAGCVIDTDW